MSNNLKNQGNVTLFLYHLRNICFYIVLGEYVCSSVLFMSVFCIIEYCYTSNYCQYTIGILCILPNRANDREMVVLYRTGDTLMLHYEHKRWHKFS